MKLGSSNGINHGNHKSDTMTLTFRQIESLKAKEKPNKASGANGLYLVVSTTGSKAWRCNYKKDGKQATKAFGMHPAISLAQVRTLNLEVGLANRSRKKSLDYNVARGFWSLGGIQHCTMSSQC